MPGQPAAQNHLRPGGKPAAHRLAPPPCLVVPAAVLYCAACASVPAEMHDIYSGDLLMSTFHNPWRYRHQRELYQRRPGMGDYEQLMGASPLNYVSFDDYLRLTERAVGSGNAGGLDRPRLSTSADAAQDWVQARRIGAANRRRLLRQQAAAAAAAEQRRQQEIAAGLLRPNPPPDPGPFLADLSPAAPPPRSRGKRRRQNTAPAAKHPADPPAYRNPALHPTLDPALDPDRDPRTRLLRLQEQWRQQWQERRQENAGDDADHGLPPDGFADDGNLHVRSAPPPAEAAAAVPPPATERRAREKAAHGGDEAAAAAQAAGRRQRATKRQMSERRAAVIHYARQTWQVGRRMAQLYIQAARRRLADDATREDHLADLQLSKLRHDHLYSRAAHWLDQCDDPRTAAVLLGRMLHIQKDRDLTCAMIKEHRAAVQRDRSPDSDTASERRRRLITMDFDEWFERMEHWRNMWWYEMLHAGYVRSGLEQTHAHKTAADAEAGLAKTLAEMAAVADPPGPPAADPPGPPAADPPPGREPRHPPDPPAAAHSPTAGRQTLSPSGAPSGAAAGPGEEPGTRP
jgi:hypothetical protein